MTITAEDLIVRQQVEDAVIRMFAATDERDWQTVESCFTDPFVLDMTSMLDGSPANMAPHQVAQAWAEGFKTLDHVHHQVGNFRTSVNGQQAKVLCYGVAFHYRARIAAPVKSRTFVGAYEFDLLAQTGKWRISKLKFILKFIEGNLELDKAT